MLWRNPYKHILLDYCDFYDHYDYFDYIGEDGKTLKFEPDSDMDFVLFKEKMKEEWINRPRNILPFCS